MGIEGFNPIDGPSPAEIMRDLRTGQKFFNRFVLKHVLGRGGMGVVWLTHDEKLDQEVALKFLPEGIRADPNAVDELKQETRRSLKLTHPNIVRIYDLVDDHVLTAISMEFVDGRTFSTWRSEQPLKIFAPITLLPCIKQLGSALDYAHIEGRTVHRDIKPSNLMMTRRGQVKIADFGVARSVCDSMTRITRNQGTSGTLAYMSPQQLTGLPCKPTDDVYALGATIYELLAGKPPFHTGDINYQIREIMPPRINERREELEIETEPVPEHWEKTIASCLSKKPAERPQSAGELYNRLNSTPRAATAFYLEPTPPPTPEPASEPAPAAPSLAARIRVSPSPAPTQPPTQSPPEPPAEIPPQPPEEAPVAEEAAEVPTPDETIAHEFRPRETKQRSFAWVWITAILVIAAAGAGAWYYFMVMQPGQRVAKNPPSLLTNAPIADTNSGGSTKHADGPKILRVSIEDGGTIQSAINNAKVGDTVHVGAGTYDETLIFKNGIILEGDGPEKTVVSCDASTNALVASDGARGVVSGIAFQHRGGNGGQSGEPVVLLAGSDVEINNCKIINSGGIALYIFGGSNFVHDCRIGGMAGTAGVGVAVWGQANTRIMHNVIWQNGKSGIYLSEGSIGVIEYNKCQAEAEGGILIAGADTVATLKGNVCLENDYGIAFEGGGHGSAEQNVCSSNRADGIFATGLGTNPKLTANQCHDNGSYGIDALNDAKPVLSANEVSGNKIAQFRGVSP